PSKESYLNMEKIIAVAKKSGAEAIHPGYGFLSENEDFAELCAKEGIVFIGPSAKAINLMGDKLQARDTMKKAGVPTVPGSDGALENLEEVQKVVEKIGLPVMIKASAGGGGKGMRLVKEMSELERSYISARNEARNFFGDDRVYVERFISNPKHIEIQIFGD